MLLQEQQRDHQKFFGPYEVLAPIEEGSQAKILLARNNEKLYGLKVYKHGHLGRSCFQNQIQILSGINDQLILKPVQIYSCLSFGPCQKVQLSQHAFLVMEYFKYGDLRHYMNSGHISLKIRNFIIKNMVKCLLATQINGVLHRDIKPQNFLIDSDYSLKLIDFGVGIHSGSQSQDIVGTTNYIAPQIYKSRNYSYKSQIFAIGVICFELAMGRKSLFPFKQAKISDPNFLLLKQKMYDRFWNKFGVLNELGAQFKQLLQKMLSPDPQERPSASQILLLNCLKQTATQQQCHQFFQKHRPASKIPYNTSDCSML